MLVNKNRRSYKWMAYAQVMLVCLLFFNQFAFAYDAWQPDNESAVIQVLDEILEEFKILLEKAKASKAAHPVFLSDLEDVLERLENQRGVIASICVESDYVISVQSYSESNKIIEPKLAYLGQDADKVGQWSSSPDGQYDGFPSTCVFIQGSGSEEPQVIQV